MSEKTAVPTADGRIGTLAGEQPGSLQEATRWVAPLGQKIPRTEHGLLDTATISNEWYSGDRPIPAADLLGTERSFVLLAPGGAGKTTLMEALKGREPDSTSIDLRMHSREGLAELVRSCSRTAGVVFIDAIDEALQSDPNLGYLLVTLLSEPAARAVSWRLACRPGSWTLDLAEGLRNALPGFEELELLPLDRRGLEEIAGADADAFASAVSAAGLTRLLAQPLPARALLDQWRSTGDLPASRVGSMRYTVGRLLAEVGRFRSPRTQDDQRMDLIAERVAAVSMFCGVGRFALGPVPRADITESAVIPVTAMPIDPEPDLPGAPLALEDFREVLGTSLFSAAGQGTVIFAHQSYAEYLSAAYLRRRRVAGRRLVSVLGADVNGVAPGPMIEVLGWLLALGVPLAADLVAANAKQLLGTAGLELADDRACEGVVEALLHGAASGSIDEGWGLDTSSLAHPNLGDQLHEAALRPANHWEVFWICRLARHCAVRDAADDLLTLAYESRWPHFIRAEAVESFAAVAPPARLGELAPLLALGPEEDPEDEILAAALRAVLPTAADFGMIATALRPRRTPNHLGRYSQLLSELPSLIDPEHVLPALRGELDRGTDRADDHAFDRLLSGLITRAWAMNDPAVAVELGRLLGQEPLSAQDVFRPQQFPWQVDDRPDLRHAMAAAALAVDRTAYRGVLDMRMLTSRDLAWLIDWIPTAPPDAREAARVVLRRLAWSVSDSDTADRLLTVAEGHPAHALLSEFRGTCDLGARPEWVHTSSAGNERTSPQRQLALFREILGRVRDETGSWWRAVVALAGANKGTGRELVFEWDLTKRPLWPLLESAEHEEFLRLGLAYLSERKPNLDTWAGRDRWVVAEAMPDWVAVFLLGTLAAQRADLLHEVTPMQWQSWASAVVAMPASIMQGVRLQMVRDSALDSGREALRAALLEHVRADSTASFLAHPLFDFADPRLLDVVASLARDPDQPPARRDAAVSALIEHAPDVALNVARETMDEDTPPSAAFDALAKLAPEEFLAPLLAAGRPGPLEHLREIDPDKLSDASLASLTRMLLDELPFRDDPELSDGFLERAPESVARRLRWQLLQSMAGRGMASHLGALSANLPAEDQAQISHLLQQARAREALARWRPLEPYPMMALLARGDARLIRDGAGLVAVLLEQLERIQRDIRERAGFRSLWNGEPGTEGATPKAEDDISDWLSHQLELRLTPHVVLDREIQVRRKGRSGVGTRMDITATAGGVPLGRVVFEAKRVQNPDLMTALSDQLVAQYMVPYGLDHGVYLVYWLAPELRAGRQKCVHPDPSQLADRLRQQTLQHRPGRHVDVFVLDIGPAA